MYEFTAANVFDALGVKYDLNVKNNIVECPMCHKKNFYMDMSKSFGHCYSLKNCGVHLNHISYYATVMGIDNKEAYRQMCVYMGYIQDKAAGKFNGKKNKNKPIKPREIKKCEIKEQKIADIVIRDKTNHLLIDTLALSDKHKKDLLERGFTEEEINRLNYRSIGYHDILSCKAIADIIQKKGGKTLGIPGFCKDKKGNISLIWTKKAILIPMVDFHKRINGFQFRKNDEDLKVFKNADGKEEKEKKMRWLSATPKNCTDGTSIPAYGHYACDFVLDFATGMHVPIFPKKEIGITEGPMKADLIHAITGNAVHGIPGVNALEQLAYEVKKWKAAGVTTVVDLFDMDYVSNANVKQQMEKLKQLILSNGLEYRRDDWNVDTGLGDAFDSLKGYDDYLAFHVRGIYKRLKKKS